MRLRCSKKIVLIELHQVYEDAHCLSCPRIATGVQIMTRMIPFSGTMSREGLHYLLEVNPSLPGLYVFY
jgi:hypothetical protein